MFLNGPAIIADRQNRYGRIVAAATRNKRLDRFKLMRPALIRQRRKCAIDCRGRKIRFVHLHLAKNCISRHRLVMAMQDTKHV